MEQRHNNGLLKTFIKIHFELLSIQHRSCLYFIIIHCCCFIYCNLLRKIIKLLGVDYSRVPIIRPYATPTCLAVRVLVQWLNFMTNFIRVYLFKINSKQSFSTVI